MSIEVNGVTLPDIPSEVLEQYPYAVILGGVENASDAICFATKEPIVFLDTNLAAMLGITGTAISCTVTGYATVLCDGDSWYLATEDTTSRFSLSLSAYSVAWSNHDILEVVSVDTSTGEFVTGEVWFPSSVSDPNYFAPKSWFDGMARQVMRLTGTSDKLTTDEMLAAVKAVELGGGLAENERIYQVGTAASTLDISTLIFESSAVGEVTS